MLDLNADMIKTYQTCSLLYKYRYVDGLFEPIVNDKLVRDRFENVLRRVLTFYFYQKQDGNQPSFKSMLNRFQKIWFGEGYTAEDIFSEVTNATHKKDKLSLAGETIKYFADFYEEFDASSAIPLMMREDFSVPIGKEIKLSGFFDVVLKEVNDYKVIKWRANNARPLNTADFFVDFAIFDHAFRHRMEGRDFNVKYYIYDFMSIHKGMNEVEVHPDDFFTLKYWCNEILRDTTYPPRRGLTTHCRGCHFNQPCSEYSITEEMLSTS